jgi:hypothetical protein
VVLVHWINEILVILLLVGLSSGQEEFEEPLPDIMPADTSGPLTLTTPDRMDMAMHEIWSVAAFMAPGYWPCPLNNSSVLNLNATQTA